MPVLELTTAGNAVVVQRVRNGHPTVEPGDQVLSIDDVMVVDKDWAEVREVLSKHTPSASTPLQLMFLIKGETRNCSFEGPVICNPPLIEPITWSNLQKWLRTLMQTSVACTADDVWEHLLVYNTYRHNTQLHSDILVHVNSESVVSLVVVLTALEERGDIAPRGVGQDVFSSLAVEPSTRITQRLKEHGLAIVKIKGDGNCQASAVSFQLFGTPDKAEEIRKEVVRYLVAHRSDYEDSLITDRYNYDDSINPLYDAENWEAYIEKVSSYIESQHCNATALGCLSGYFLFPPACSLS
jgi:hypothetical protein